MSSYESKDISIFETQKEIIREILEQKKNTGEIKSQAELERELTSLLAGLKPAEPLVTIRPQEGQTNADMHNLTFEELNYDINTAFAQTNKVDETITKHQRLNQSLLNNIQLRIRQVQDELVKHERTGSSNVSQQLHLETFKDSNGFENDSTFYIDNGQQFSIDFRAKLDLQREVIKLPTISAQNALIGSGGVRLGRIKIGKQLGSDLIRLSNPANSVDKAIDTDDLSFWSESILVDTPIEVSMGDDYYDVDHGAVVALEITFDYLTQLNEIGFNVFGEYPLDVVGVRYYTTDNIAETGVNLIHDGQATPSMKSRIVKQSTSYQFEDVYAKRLIIVLRQRHYIKSDFIASSRNQRDMELWFKREVSDEDTDLGDLDFKPTYQNKIESSNSWWQFRKATGRLRTITDINELIAELNQDQPQIVTKYEYNYGLYNLDLRKNEYQDVGIYVSKPIAVNGNIRTFMLETDEEHPVISVEGGTLTRLTDIEYSVHDGRQWHNILPMGQEGVSNELLTFEATEASTYQASLRFTPDSDIELYRNEILADADADSSVIDGITVVTIPAADFDGTAIYTAAYIPTDTAKQIDFINVYTEGGVVQPIAMQEEFTSTSREGSIVLRHFPYVDKEKLNSKDASWNPTYLGQEADEDGYVPIKVKIIDPSGYHIEQPMYVTDAGTRVENVTDYFDTSSSHLQPYDESENVFYQYEVIGNKIQFNTIIPEGTRIFVEYPYLVGDIRMKVVLRRNVHGFYGLTPVLNEYITHMQTLV